MRALALILGLSLLLGSVGCVSETGPVDAFRCRKQADCPTGRVCYLGYCDPDPDAGTADVSEGARPE